MWHVCAHHNAYIDAHVDAHLNAYIDAHFNAYDPRPNDRQIASTPNLHRCADAIDANSSSASGKGMCVSWRPTFLRVLCARDFI
jgi:hypothetical protein